MSLTIKSLPTHEHMVRNILAVYSEATKFDHESGGDWYARTGAFCREIADMFGYPHENAIGAYAVISPSLDKEQNDRQFVTGVIAHNAGWDVTKVRIGVYGRRNREKFIQCLEGNLSVIGGNKVTRFYQNLLTGAHNNVTVDRWACRVALRNPSLNEKSAVPSSPKVYHSIAEAYVDAADREGVAPHVMQAITWECYRNKYYKKSTDTYK